MRTNQNSSYSNHWKQQNKIASSYFVKQGFDVLSIYTYILKEHKDWSLKIIEAEDANILCRKNNTRNFCIAGMASVSKKNDKKYC